MRLSPIIKDKKVTYSNSSLKLRKERKYATKLIPYIIFLIFLVVVEDVVVEDSRRYHKSFAKASKGRCFHNSQLLSLFQCFAVFWSHQGL